MSRMSYSFLIQNLQSLKLLAFLIIPCLLLTACSYTVSSSSNGFNTPPKRILLASIQNKITPPRPGLEFDLTRQLKNEITLDRRFELTAYNPDLRIEIILKDLQEPTFVRDSINRQTEIGLILKVQVVIHQASQEQTFSLLSQADYVPGLGESREQGLQRLWRNLGREVLDEIMFLVHSAQTQP